MIKYIGLILLICVCLKVVGQTPVVTSLSNNFGTVNQEILITGSDFSDNFNDMKVFFGASRGTVMDGSENSLKVIVPAGVTTDNVQVINTLNHLSGFSRSLFSLSYSGNIFSSSSFDSERTFSNAMELFDLCLGDFDNDGKPDVATTQEGTAVDIIIYQNVSTPGTINFNKLSKSTNPELDLNSITSNIIAGDLNGDGLLDLVVSKEGTPRNVVFIFKNISSSGSIKFGPPQSLFLHTEDIAKRVDIRDLNQDGKPEVIVTNTYVPEIHIFKNESTSGNIQFSPEQFSVSVAGAGTSNGLIVEDLNNDGKPELVTNPFINSDVFICRNTSTTENFSFDAPQKISVPGNLNNMVPADFNNDGKIDFAVTKTIQNEVMVMINDTNNQGSTFSFQSVSLATDQGPWGINTADMNGDGKSDILVATRDARQVDVFINVSTSSATAFTKYQINTLNYTRNICGGDIDGDAKPDLIFTSFDDNTLNYTLSVFRNSNCFIPKISPAGPLTICAGVVKTLQASKGIGITYNWDNNNVTIKDNTEDTLNITGPGTYKVVATSESGACVFASNAVIVSQSTDDTPALPVIYNDGPFCQGSAITLSTDDVLNGVYDWNGPNGYFSSSKDIAISGATITDAGEYTLQVTVGDCSSNIASTVVEINTIQDFEIVTSGSAEICSGNSVQLSVPLASGYTYQWYLNGQPVSGQTNHLIDVSQAGTYDVEVTQTSTLCSVLSTNSIDVSVREAPVADFNLPDRGCIDADVSFVNTSTFAQGANVTYSWNFGDGSAEVTSNNPVYTYDNAGTYQIMLTIAYASGSCSNSTIKSLTINSNPTFSITRIPDSDVCAGDTVFLSTSDAFSSYTWNSDRTSRELPVTNAGNYTVIVKDANNCSAKQTISVAFLENPEITAKADNYKVDPGSTVKLEASGAMIYHWTPGEYLNDSTIATPEATLSKSAEFIVEGENSLGCTDTASVYISVNEGNEIFVKPKKLFSPNGDGIDDMWVIDNIEAYPESSIVIFNGNGSTVYEASPYKNDWSAVYEGKDLPEGAYFFVIRSPGKDPRTGSITLIR